MNSPAHAEDRAILCRMGTLVCAYSCTIDAITSAGIIEEVILRRAPDVGLATARSPTRSASSPPENSTQLNSVLGVFGHAIDLTPRRPHAGGGQLPFAVAAGARAALSPTGSARLGAHAKRIARIRARMPNDEQRPGRSRCNRPKLSHARYSLQRSRVRRAAPLSGSVAVTLATCPRSRAVLPNTEHAEAG